MLPPALTQNLSRVNDFESMLLFVRYQVILFGVGGHWY